MCPWDAGAGISREARYHVSELGVSTPAKITYFPHIVRRAPMSGSVP